MTKKKLGGSTSMATFSGSQSTNRFLLQLLVLAPNYLPCKDVFEAVLLNSFSLIKKIAFINY